MDGLNYLVDNAKEGENFYGIKDIRTVFLKTGFMYDDDKCVKSDVVISGDDFLKILSKYAGNSEILDSYITHLENSLQWYVDLGNYEGNTDSISNWNIVNYQIAQYRLMRDIFPESLWIDRSSWQYRVYHGTSFGRPWTQMQIDERCYVGSSDYFSVFWRIDTDKKEPYISLRLYEDFDKNNIAQKERHRKLYEVMFEAMKAIIGDDLGYKWCDVYPEYRGNYKESSIIHIKLKDKLMNWSESREKLIKDIHYITEKMNEKLDEFVNSITALRFLHDMYKIMYLSFVIL